MAFKRSPVRSRLAPLRTPLRRGFVFLGVAAAVLLGACASEGGSNPSPLETLRRYVLGDGTTENGVKLLTTERLREVSRARGVGSGPAAMPFNREVGAAFQEWALAAFPHPLIQNFANFLSPYRQRSTSSFKGGPVFAVRPDSVGPIASVIWERMLDVPRPRLVTMPASVLIEVKAVRGALLPSSNRYQIGGLIEVAATSPAARMADTERPTPAVIFITTGDASISPLVLELAGGQGVAIWQTVAFELPGSTTSDPRFGLGPVVPLNREVYGEFVPQPLPPGLVGVPFPLPRPRLPPDPSDPDPPEVQ